VVAHRLPQPFQSHPTLIQILNTLHVPGEQHHSLRHQHLARLRQRTQPCSEIQGPSPKARLHRHRLASIYTDPDPEWQIGPRADLVCKVPLHRNRAPNRRPWRVKHTQRLVTTKLDHLATTTHHLPPNHLRKACGKNRGCLIATRLRKSGIPTNIRDQERADGLSRRGAIIGHGHGSSHNCPTGQWASTTINVFPRVRPGRCSGRSGSSARSRGARRAPERFPLRPASCSPGGCGSRAPDADAHNHGASVLADRRTALRVRRAGTDGRVEPVAEVVPVTASPRHRVGQPLRPSSEGG
jgi:hypothetical protein